VQHRPRPAIAPAIALRCDPRGPLVRFWTNSINTRPIALQGAEKRTEHQYYDRASGALPAADQRYETQTRADQAEGGRLRNAAAGAADNQINPLDCQDGVIRIRTAATHPLQTSEGHGHAAGLKRIGAR